MRNKERKGKWQPFDALSGFHESLEVVNYQQEKVARPTLSADKKEQINDNLTIALEQNYDIIIQYYFDGYIYSLEGKIEKVDVVNQAIKINNKTINLFNIVDITVK